MYDRIGTDYRHGRRQDPRIAAAVWAALGDASPVLNVGAGAGSYEPDDRPVVASELSAVMLSQHPPGAVLQGPAEALPFRDNSFGAAMGVLTVHHWSDRARGLAEMRRVSRGPVVLFVRDGEAAGWLVGCITTSRPRRGWKGTGKPGSATWPRCWAAGSR